MVSGGLDTTPSAPKVLVLPERKTHTISGAKGDITISGGNLYFWHGSAWMEISGGKALTV